jgi:hypothetical protein
MAKIKQETEHKETKLSIFLNTKKVSCILTSTLAPGKQCAARGNSIRKVSVTLMIMRKQ